MPQQTISRVFRVLLSAYARLYVVIHFDIAHAVVFNKSVDDRICVCAHLFAAEVELIARAVENALAVPHEEPGEKYGDIVRVVDMGGYSVELCGGAHLKNTAQVGSFKIVSENGVAAGVRRIEALTGEGALLHYQAQEDEVRTLAQMVKTSPDKLVARVEQLLAEQKELSKELEKLKAKMAGGAADEMLSKKVDINGVAVLAAEVKDMDANAMRTLGDQLKNKLGSGVIVLAGAAGGKVSLMAMATDDVVKKGAHAGNIIKAAAAVCGGGGGGRPNMAQAGGKDASKIADALEKAKEIIAEQMK